MKSGRILAEVREFVRAMAIQGKPVLDVCEDVEGKIRELGANPAFPCNVGINDTAAHYTSPYNDQSVVPADSLVKVDFGVELEGFITDSAIADLAQPNL